MGNRQQAAPPTHEQKPPRSFRERLNALAGGTTFREPSDGAGTKPRELPAAHELAAALGMARAGKDDVGPDIALDVILGRTSYAVRVCATVSRALGADRARAIGRSRPWLRVVCWAAYVELVYGMPQPQLRPQAVTEADWDLLTEAARRIFEQLADEAVYRAARAWRREAA